MLNAYNYMLDCCLAVPNSDPLVPLLQSLESTRRMLSLCEEVSCLPMNVLRAIVYTVLCSDGGLESSLDPETVSTDGSIFSLGCYRTGEASATEAS